MGYILSISFIGDRLFMEAVKDQKLIDLVNNIKHEITETDFIKDLELSLNGNKSASARARKKSVELGKLFKTYRALSVEDGLV